MEQSTAYCIMILSPIIPWLLKTFVSYNIRYKVVKKNVDRFFKKNKTSLIKRSLYVDFRKDIPIYLFLFNIFLSIITTVYLILGISFFVMLLCNYKLPNFVIPKSIVVIDIIQLILLLIFGLCDAIEGPR